MTALLITIVIALNSSYQTTGYGEPDYIIKSKIYLTFDDGPSPHTTQRLLGILKEKEVKATFFILGQLATAYPNIVKEIFDDGHTIGNHGYTHQSFVNLSQESLKSSIEQTQKAIYNACGLTPHLVRPPYGSISSSEINLLQNLELKTVLWDIDTLDWKTRNSAKTTAVILKEARPLAIILVHDIHPETVDAMPVVIDELKKQYELVGLD